MPDKYYQEYGPIRRRRNGAGPEVDSDEPQEQALERPVVAPVPRRAERRLRRPQRKRRSLLGPLLIIAAAVGAVLALPYAATLMAADRANQGVTVQGQAVGGMSRAALHTELQGRYDTFLQAPITLTFEGKTWTPSAGELGVTLDIDDTADSAVTIGRRGGPLERISELAALWQGGYDVAPRLTLDEGRLQRYLASIAADLEQPPRDAALSLAAGNVIPTGSQRGRQLLVDATALDVRQALITLQPQQVVLRTRVLEPRLGDEQLAQAMSQAKALLQAPITISQGERSWTWDKEKLAELLSVRSDNGQMRVEINPERLNNAVQKLAQLVDTGTSEPRVSFGGGGLSIDEPGQIGLKLQQPEAAAAISATLQAETRTLALPVEQITPQVTPESLASLGIVELVGEGTTSFAGSADYRIANIKAGARRMDGVLIPPDTEFSFNTQLGEVDEANGFVQGYAVIGNRTQLEWGGGVCQDSTTLFRAAFWAGLPITEWHAHPFYISWYDAYAYPNENGPGMDASIYTGVSDFKFFNDTGHWLLLEAEVDDANQTLTMRLFGTKPNRTVEVVGPSIENISEPPSEATVIYDSSLPSGTVKQTDTARKGMDIVVYRVITESGSEREPEPFVTRFKPWPNVYVKGTG